MNFRVCLKLLLKPVRPVGDRNTLMTVTLVVAQLGYRHAVKGRQRLSVKIYDPNEITSPCKGPIELLS